MVSEILYYLNSIKEHIEKTYEKGACNKSLDIKNFNKMLIPILPIEKQNEIVAYLDFIYEQANKTSYKKIDELKMLNNYYLTHQLANNTSKIKTLKELCNFLPKSKRNAKYGKSKGLYPFYTSSQTCSKYCDEYDYEDECLIIGDGGEPNINYDVKFSASDHCYILQNNDKLIKTKYMYYYVYNNLDVIKQLFRGVGIANISKTNIEKIKIPIPSLEIQQEIIDYCEFNDKLIKQLELEIKINENKAQKFLSSQLRNQNITYTIDK